MGFYSPATLVKDAQRHGVPVLPVDVVRSNWSCTLEQDPSALAVRLGLRYISGLRQETGERIEQQRLVRSFSSTADFAARVGLNKRELDSLAHGGAFSSFGVTRRDALWQVSALDRDPASLFARVPPPGIRSPLPQMDALEETAADFATTGLTTARHPISYLRDLLRSSGVLSAADLGSAKDGSWVSVAGVVIVRQRPGTAQGFLFVTLEDETGLANAIVTPDVFQQQRVLLRRARILKIGGPLQKVDGVIHVRARKLDELELASQVPESRDFR
jgi:error-prone DNA polymerase